MLSLLNIIELTVVSIASAVGILADAFIATMNLLDWFKGRDLTKCDQVLVCLAVSHACFQATAAAKTYVFLIWRDIYNGIFPVIVQLELWTAFYSFWLTACLCVFYCVKIVDFNCPLWIWLKMRIYMVVPWVLLGSLMGSLGLSIPAYWNSNCNIVLYKSANNMDNATVPCREPTLNMIYRVPVHVVGFCLPLLLGMASITLILTSLRRHTRQMKENMSGFSQPRLEAHKRAARMVGFFLLILCPLFLGGCLRVMKIQSFWFNKVIQFILIRVTPAQSIIVIWGNAKLKQGLRKLFTLWSK